MGIVKQHIPNFVDGVKPKTSWFDSKKQLESIEWINNFSKYSHFSRFCISRKAGQQPLIIAEYNDGYEWWVVGRILEDDNNVLATMQKWRPKVKTEKPLI